MNFAKHNYTRADLKRFHKEAQWVDDHFDELHAKYPEHFVGVVLHLQGKELSMTLTELGFTPSVIRAIEDAGFTVDMDEPNPGVDACIQVYYTLPDGEGEDGILYDGLTIEEYEERQWAKANAASNGLTADYGGWCVDGVSGIDIPIDTQRHNLKGEVITASPDLFKVADDIAAMSLKLDDVFINFIPYEQTAFAWAPFRVS